MLVILADSPTPCRTVFYDALAEEAARVGKRFNVFYCSKSSPRRSSAYDPSKIRHAHAVLRGFHPTISGVQAHVNPGVLAELNLLKPDTLILAGAWNTPTMLVAGLNIYSPAPRRFFWSEGKPDEDSKEYGLAARLRRRIYRTYDGFIVPDTSSGEWALAQAGGPRQLVEVSHLIDTGFFAPQAASCRQEARRRLGFAGNVRVLLQMPDLTNGKKVAELARCFLGLLPEVRRGARLVFIVDGDQRASLEELATQSSGVISVKGGLSSEEARTMLLAADVFISNGSLDASPIPMVEAVAVGLPIVLFEAAAKLRELVAIKHSGFLIGDPDNPAEALRAVLTSSDQELAGRRESASMLFRGQFGASTLARSVISQLYPSAGRRPSA